MKLEFFLCNLWLLRSMVVVFVTMPSCQNFPTGHPAKPGKYYQQKPQNLNKTATCSHHCPFWHEHRLWGIGISGYTFGFTIQARAISLHSWALLSWWLQAIYRVSNEHLPSILQKKRLFLLFMIVFSDYTKKDVIFDEIYLFSCGVYLSSDICQMHWAD